MTPPHKMKMTKRVFTVHAKNGYGTRCHSPACDKQLKIGDAVVTKQVDGGNSRALYCLKCAEALNIV